MKFGKTLEEIVRSDWKEYALNYRQMKKFLPKEVGETISSEQDKQFWSIFDRSKRVLASFYQEKEEWAENEVNGLQERVDCLVTCKTSPSDTSSRPSSSDTRKLDALIYNFLAELDLLINFLRINQTGFSKILKKYDKRNFSNVRDDKLKELAKTHSFLDCKNLLLLKNRANNIKRKIFPSTSTASIQDMSRQEIENLGQNIKFLDTIEQGSPFFAKNKKRQQPTFEMEEIQTGSILGAGEYGVVREIKKINVTDHCPICFLNNDFFNSVITMETNESTSQKIGATKRTIDCDDISALDDDDLKEEHEEEIEGDEANRGFMRHHCLRETSARYVIKQLKRDLNETQRIDGSIDIAIEAKFLSALSHSNVIKIRGIGGLSGHSNFFILLDRLNDTLGERCEKWKKSEKKFEGFMGINKKKSDLRLLFGERLMALFDICRAMSYLHRNLIVYRDLKPENIGFDVRDNAKIFDFGLAKELHPKDKTGHDQYLLSGKTGTRRYMAPEVVLCKPYGKSADVYSFAILMWQVLALEEPYPGYDYEKHAKLVVRGKKRPQVKSSWPVLICDIMKEAWSAEAVCRPDFSRLSDIISGELHSFGLSVSNRSESMSSRMMRI